MEKALMFQKQTARQLLYQALKPKRYQAGVYTAWCQIGFHDYLVYVRRLST
jgi:hypothetical protein